VARYVRDNFAARRKVVLIAEVDPPAGWDRLLPSHRSDELERRLRRLPDTVVCHLRVQAMRERAPDAAPERVSGWRRQRSVTTQPAPVRPSNSP
jgi:hypothetical protein